MVNSFYKASELLSQELHTQGFVTTTIGDMADVDLNRQNIYPLAHVLPQPVTLKGSTITYRFLVTGMDLVDFNKDRPRDLPEPTFETVNVQDIFNDIAMRLANTVVALSRGDISYQHNLEVIQENELDPFFERFENLLAGWSITINITMKNDADIC